MELPTPELGLRPSETGIEATAQAARRVGSLYNEAGSSLAETGREIGSGVKAAGDAAVQYMSHREISQGAASFATMNDNLTQAWNDTAKNADPNDPTVAAKFREQTLEPALAQYRDSFLTDGGQKFAEGRVEALRNHMFEKTSADMSSMAKDAVAVNIKQTSNSLSNTAMSDPSSVPTLLDNADALVGGVVGSSPNIKGADASRAHMELTEKMKEGIVKSGAIGAIQKADDPEAEAAKWGAKYPQYISGDELKMLSQNARAQSRAQRIDEAYIGRVQDKEAQDKSDAQETHYRQALYSDDPKQQSQVTSKAVMNDPTLSLPAKKALVSTIERETKPETDAKISAATSVQLFRKIMDPDADPQQLKQAIYEARAKDPGTPGSITKADFDDAMKNLEGKKTAEGQALSQDRTEFLKQYGKTIDPSMSDDGHNSALGAQKIYSVQKELTRQEQFLKSQGKDPHSLYDPDSPNFFGKPGNIQKYRVTTKQASNYQAELGGGKNLTGPGKSDSGVQVIDVPAGMSPADVIKQYRSGQHIRLPDGRMGTVP